jgi:hypothetical protein
MSASVLDALPRPTPQRRKSERNPQSKSPAARFLGGICVRTGLEIGSPKNEEDSNSRAKSQSLPTPTTPTRFVRVEVFAWRPTPPWNDNRAAQYVMRRYRVAPHTAVVIAALAGFGGSEER